MPSWKPKPFKYASVRVKTPDLRLGKKVTRQKVSNEVLTGYVGNKKASDLEERVARAHSRLNIPFSFRVRVTPLIANLQQKLTSSMAVIPGETEIDFLGQASQTYPLFIDGEIAHFRTPYQEEKDRVKTEAVNAFGRMYGWHEAVRIPFTKLVDQDMTDRTIREVYGL